MTQQETPDPLGFLLSDPTPRSTNETDTPAFPTGVVAPVSPPAVGAFPTRRELRLQREAAERAEAAAASSEEASEPVVLDEPVLDEPVLAEPVPAELVEAPADADPERSVVESSAPEPSIASPSVPLAPAHVISDTMVEPEALAPRRGRLAKRRPGGRRVDVARRRTTRQRITGTATMLVVGGIFASLTLPAYAFSGATTAAAPVVQDTATQNLHVASDAAPAGTRDAYSATSASDLRAVYLAQTRKTNTTVYSRSTAQSLGDDYPWYDMPSRNQGGGLSPLRYYYRECVDFVAWRLNRDAGFTSAPYKYDWASLTPGNGNASGWKSAWESHGWATGSTPVAGAVAWYSPGQNHVAYVKSVLPDGSVLLEEYNYDSDHQYDQRIASASSIAAFLYAPPR